MNNATAKATAERAAKIAAAMMQDPNASLEIASNNGTLTFCTNDGAFLLISPRGYHALQVSETPVERLAAHVAGFIFNNGGLVAASEG